MREIERTTTTTSITTTSTTTRYAAHEIRCRPSASVVPFWQTPAGMLSVGILVIGAVGLVLTLAVAALAVIALGSAGIVVGLGVREYLAFSRDARNQTVTRSNYSRRAVGPM